MNREIREDHEKILYKDESYAIQGAILDVYGEMGCGFLAVVYQECLEREMRRRQIPFEVDRSIPIHYKGDPLRQVFKPDFICYDRIVVEVKAVSSLLPEHKAQLLNFLKASGLGLGILANFGSHPKVEMQRFANTHFSRFSRVSRLNNEVEN